MLFYSFELSLSVSGLQSKLRMAGDSRVHMDHDMEIGVTPREVSRPQYHCHLM